MIKKINWQQILFYFIGLNILAIGTVMAQFGQLGVGALTSFPQILSMILKITVGQAIAVFFVILIIMEFILIRKFKAEILLQLVLAFAFGTLVDFYEVHLGLANLQLSGLVFKLALTLVSILLTSIGIFIMVKADFILMPTDALVRAITKLTSSKFGKIKFCFDFSSVMISLILSIIFLGHIAAIGIGTIAAAVFVGQLISIWEMLIKNFKFNQKLN